MTMNTYTETYTLMQAARLLGMNKNKACRWASKGIIRTVRIPMGRYGRHIVTSEEVQRVKELLSGRTDNS